MESLAFPKFSRSRNVGRYQISSLLKGVKLSIIHKNYFDLFWWPFLFYLYVYSILYNSHFRPVELFPLRGVHISFHFALRLPSFRSFNYWMQNQIEDGARRRELVSLLNKIISLWFCGRLNSAIRLCASLKFKKLLGKKFACRQNLFITSHSLSTPFGHNHRLWSLKHLHFT